VRDRPTAAQVIVRLGLEPHPEGGFFRETYRSPASVEAPQGRRATATAIAFLLTADRPSRFHRLLSDELWVYQGGAPLELWLLEPAGTARAVVLGAAEGRGDALPSARVPAGTWQAARVVGPTALDWALVSCVVTPGFDYADFELGRRAVLAAGAPASSRSSPSAFVPLATGAYPCRRRSPSKEATWPAHSRPTSSPGIPGPARSATTSRSAGCARWPC
jgi:hypothetical protein